MPDHVHMVLSAESSLTVQRKLSRLLAGSSCATHVRGLWERVPEPAVIPDRKHLLRAIRYVHLNPCRDSLAADPLSWPWSTHRGVLGAEFRPWVDARGLSTALGKPFVGFNEWFHRYVSGDPCVTPSGTPLCRPPAVGAVPSASLADIRNAVIAAAPFAAPTVLRAGFIALARAHGCHDVALLARVAKISHQHALRLSKRRDDALLAAASLCLGDARLRSHVSDAPGAVVFLR